MKSRRMAINMFSLFMCSLAFADDDTKRARRESEAGYRKAESNLAAALQHFESAVHFAPKMGTTYNDLGVTYMRLGACRSVVTYSRQGRHLLLELSLRPVAGRLEEARRAFESGLQVTNGKLADYLIRL